MSEMKDRYFSVLDDGFIALKDYMGSDESIEQAARVSYGKGTRKTSDTRNLIRYLFRHYHTTPQEMVELVFHVRLPIYCCRQWHRHRTWSFNEYSGRYSEMIDSTECASSWRSQSGTNKQGSDGTVTEWPDGYSSEQFNVGRWRGHGEALQSFVHTPNTSIDSHHWDKGFSSPPYSIDGDKEATPSGYLSSKEIGLNKLSRDVYEERLKFGVAKEQARKDLPVSNYTEMYAKVDLKNLFGFLRLRCDSHAQIEIRQYANVMAGIVKELFPIAYEAWEDYNFLSSPLSHLDKQLLSYMMCFRISIEDIERKEDIKKIIEDKYKTIGMSGREYGEFIAKVSPSDRPEFDLSSALLYDLVDKE